MAEVKNLSADEAERRLAAQLEPRDERASGIRGDQNYVEATAEAERLAREMRIGHDRPESK